MVIFCHCPVTSPFLNQASWLLVQDAPEELQVYEPEPMPAMMSVMDRGAVMLNWTVNEWYVSPVLVAAVVPTGILELVDRQGV